VAIAGLTVGMLMWLGAFLTFGSEWFLMWQVADDRVHALENWRDHCRT
jgi:predicted small integral membrane protein